MKKKIIFFFALAIATMGFGQTVVLNEGFDDITTLTGSGWQMTNQSSPVGGTGWFQGGSGTTFPGQAGGQTSYVGANYNNTTGGTGTISNWLITPTQNLKDGDQLKFWTRTATGSTWADRLEVRSSTGTMTLPTGATGVGSFTKVELTINGTLVGNGYPQVWTEYTVTVAGVGSTPVPMNFAFRYYVTAAGPDGTNSNFIGIDTLSITTVAPPSHLTVDLSVANQVTVTSTAALSSGTVSGDPFDGFYLKDFFSNAGTVGVPVSPGFIGTPTLTAASVATNNNPRMFRASSGADPGFNIWGFSAATSASFTTGQVAFTGSVTWTVSAAVYNAALTAPDAGGDVYFPTEGVAGLGSATLIGKYTVVKPAVAPSCTTITAPANGATGVNTNPTITWNTAAGATGYKVYIGTSTGNYNVVNGTEVAVTQYAATLSAGTQYFVKIVPTNTGGDATSCTEISFTTDSCIAGTGTGNIPDNQPANPLVINFNITGLTGTVNNVELDMTGTHTWVGDIIATLYAPDGTSHIIFSRTGTTTSSTVGDSSDFGGPYKFHDAATANWWEAAATAGSAAQIPAGDYRTTAAGPQPTAGTSPVTNMNAAFASVANPNGTWVLRVSDNSALDTGSITAACLKITTGTMAVSEVSGTKVSVYPNPVTDILNVSADKSVKSVSIFNAAGQMVVSGAKLNNGQINVSRLASGVYMMNILYDNGKTETVKVIKK